MNLYILIGMLFAFAIYCYSVDTHPTLTFRQKAIRIAIASLIFAVFVLLTP